jgi:hypothetical protein
MSGRTLTTRPYTPSAGTSPKPIPSARTGGQPLDNHTRSSMSARFGHDFSSIRVHTDAQAHESAEAVGAAAFAQGSDIVFGGGQYTPGSAQAERLLAHELTHVVQQAKGGPGDPNRVSDRADASEREAEDVTDRVLSGESVSVEAAPQAAVARWGLDDYNPNPTPTLPNGPVHLGNQPADKSVSGPYAYDNYDPVKMGGYDVPGGSAGFGLFHGRGDIGGVPVGDDLGFANMNWGAMDDGAGNQRVGVKGNAAVASMDFNKGGAVSGDVQAFNANAEASFGSDGATLGAGANIVAGSVSAHDDHEMVRGGLSYGVGLAGRTHWGQDKDGYRNYGLGVDFGPFSGDITTNDPLRTGMDMVPGMGLLPSMMGVDPKENITEDAANVFGLTTKNADLGTTWDVAKGAASDVYNGAAGVASNVYHGASDMATGAYNTASDTAATVYHGAANVASDAYDGVSNVASGAYNTVSDAISNFDPLSILN